jgi:hypothetical protein
MFYDRGPPMVMRSDSQPQMPRTMHPAQMGSVMTVKDKPKVTRKSVMLRLLGAGATRPRRGYAAKATANCSL